MNNRIFVFAPHFTLPASNGADILVIDRWVNLIEYGYNITIFGSSAVYSFTSKSDYSVEPFFSRMRSSLQSALQAFLTQTDYLYCKFITPDVKCALKKHLAGNSYDFVVASFLYSSIALNLLSPAQSYTPDFCELHNDDWNWNRTLLRLGKKPSLYDHLRRLFMMIVLSSSAKFFRNNVTSAFARTSFISLSSKDLSSVSKKILYGSHVCIPPGVPTPVNFERSHYFSLRNEQQGPSLNLLFIGSLGCKMSIDAIDFFFERFYKKFPGYLRSKCNLYVAGSRPSSHIYKLSKIYSFRIIPNFLDSETDNLFIHSDFLIAPFPYTNGAKIKILQALSYGLPILGTKCVSLDDSIPFTSCLFSDDPAEWVDHLTEHICLSLNTRYLLRKNLQRQSIQLDWSNRTHHLISLLHPKSL